MPLKLYNTLSRNKEEFKPIKEGFVGMYCCGPTVYNYAHIGNLRAYLFVDMLRKYLKYLGYKLKHVMNITDVDDKTIRDSQKQHQSLSEFTKFYTNELLEDLKTLNIEVPEILPRASEEIDGMVKLIKELLAKGFAYKTDKGDIYFKISKFKDYGKLARLDPANLKKNADGRLNDADEYGKDDARDFALWKAYDASDGDVFWDTDLGKGRPGWHIECSFMSSKYLGQPFDIHTGGVDLIFPHHTNEIAQSEAASGKKLANFWLHNEHLIVNGEKMSKSLGNFFTLRELLKKGHDTRAIRYEILSTHYRAKLDFREDNLGNVKNTIDKFSDFLDKLDYASGTKDDDHVEKLIEKAKDEFVKSMDDDLNISGALASIFDFMREINKIMADLSKHDAEQVKDAMIGFDSVIGVMIRPKSDIPKDIIELCDKREEARKKKDFALSDKLRSEIQSKGFILEDSKEGVRVKKA